MKTTRKLLSIALALVMALGMTISSSAFVTSNRYITLYYGNSQTLTLDTDMAKEDVTFVSSNPSVASVDENGVVKSNGIGECVITCTDKQTGESDQCTVKVALIWWEPARNLFYYLKNLPYVISLNR